MGTPLPVHPLRKIDPGTDSMTAQVAPGNYSGYDYPEIFSLGILVPGIFLQHGGSKKNRKRFTQSKIFLQGRAGKNKRNMIDPINDTGQLNMFLTFLLFSGNEPYGHEWPVHSPAGGSLRYKNRIDAFNKNPENN